MRKVSGVHTTKLKERSEDEMGEERGALEMEWGRIIVRRHRRKEREEERT